MSSRRLLFDNFSGTTRHIEYFHTNVSKANFKCVFRKVSEQVKSEYYLVERCENLILKYKYKDHLLFTQLFK